MPPIPIETQGAMEFGAGFLLKFGFIGVALMFLAIAWFTRTGNKLFAMSVGAFGVAFLVAYGVLNLSLTFFPGLLVKPGTFLVGELAGVPTAVRVRMRAENQRARPPYVRVENDPEEDGLQRYQFVFAYDQAFSCFTVYVTYPSSEDRQENEHSFNIAEMAEAQVRAGSRLFLAIEGEGRDSKIIVEQLDGMGKVSGKREVEPLEFAASPVRACGRAQRNAGVSDERGGFGFLVSSAHAQSAMAPDADRFRRMLTSEDPIVRRAAREDLAEYGAQASPVLKQFLDSNSYRLQLGATEAIKQMPANNRSSVLKDVGPQVEQLQSSRDKTLSESARSANTPR